MRVRPLFAAYAFFLWIVLAGAACPDDSADNMSNAAPPPNPATHIVFGNAGQSNADTATITHTGTVMDVLIAGASQPLDVDLEVQNISNILEFLVNKSTAPVKVGDVFTPTVGIPDAQAKVTVYYASTGKRWHAVAGTFKIFALTPTIAGIQLSNLTFEPEPGPNQATGTFTMNGTVYEQLH